MKTRILHTKLWKDSFFSKLSISEKILFVYFLTNEKVNIIHCYEITDREIMFDTGINSPTIEVFKQKVTEAKKMFFFKDFVYLYNATKYENYTGGKNEAAKEKLIDEMNPEIKGWFINIKNNPINTSIDRGIYTPSIGTINHKSEIINNKLKTKDDTNNKINTKNEMTLDDKAKWVMDTFNEIFGKKLKSFVAIKQNLEYWLSSGYTSIDIKKAFEIAKYDEYWGKIITPTIMLRRKNTRGEEVDYIGQFLAKDEQYKPYAQRKTKGILDQLLAKENEGGQDAGNS